MGALYPAEYAFATGHISGEFLGVPIADGRFFAKFVPASNSTELATISATASSNSWVGRFSGNRDVSLEFKLSQPPSNSIETAFGFLFATVSNAWTNVASGVTGIDADAIGAQALTALSQALPKAAFEVALPDIAVPAAYPEWPLCAWFKDPILAGYSIYYDFNAPLTTLSNRVRHDGGLFAVAGLAISLDSATAVEIAQPPDLASVPHSVMEVAHAELAVTPAANGMPRLAGLISNVTVHLPAPFTKAAFNANAWGEFDTAGNPLVRAHGTVSAFQIPGSGLPVAFRLSSCAGPMAADFSLARGSSLSDPPVMALTLEPAALFVSMLGTPELVLHGSAGLNAPMTFSTSTGVDALATFATPCPSLRGAQLKSGGNSFDLVIDGQRLATISGLPETAFHVTGTGLDDFQLELALSTSDSALTVDLFPDVTMQNLPSGLQHFTLPASRSGQASVSFFCNSSSQFRFEGRFDANVPAQGGPPGFPGFSTGAHVIIDNSGVHFDENFGTAPASAAAWLDVSTAGTVSGGGELRIGPFTWGCVTLSASGGINGSFNANQVGGGIDLSGQVHLSFPCLSPDEFNVPSLQSLHLNSSGQFCTNIANMGSQAFRFAGYPVTLDTLEVCGVRSDGDHPDEYVRLDFTGRLDLSPVLSNGVRGFIAFTNTAGGNTVNRGAYHLEMASTGQAPLLGLNFANVSASFTGTMVAGTIGEANFPALTMSGELPFLPSPLNQRFSGTLGPNLLLDLKNSAGNWTAPVFALQNMTNFIKYQPGQYASTVTGDHPAGYWRLEDSGSTAADLVGYHWTDDGIRMRRVNDHPTHNGTYVGDSSQRRPGAFDSDVNKAVGFADLSTRDDRYTPPFIQVNYGADFNFANALTLEAWVNLGLPFGARNGSTIVSKYGSWGLFIEGNQDQFESEGHLNFSIATSSSSLRSAARYDDGKWHHVVGIFDGFVQYLYVDGRLDNSSVTYGSTALPANNNPVVLGRIVGPGGCTLDEVAVYGSALLPGDVIDHYLAGGRGGVRLDATVGGLPGVPSAHVVGLLGPNQTAVMQVQFDTDNPVLGLPGLAVSNLTATIVSASGSSFASFVGDLRCPGLSGGDVLGTARGYFTSAGDFNVRLSQPTSPNFAGFTLRLDMLQSSGRWTSPRSASGSAGGTLTFPHNAGSAHFSGTINTLSNTFMLRTANNISLSLAGQNFAASEHATLTEQSLSVQGNLKLGTGANDPSLHVALSLARNGDIACGASGNTGWVGFPGVWAYFDWTAGFSFDTTPTGNLRFRGLASGTFYGSTPDHPDHVGDIPGGDHTGYYNVTHEVFGHSVTSSVLLHTDKVQVGPYEIGTDSTVPITRGWGPLSGYDFKLVP